MTYPDWDEIRNADFVRSRDFPMIEADMPTFMGLPLVTFPEEDLKDADAVIIGAPYVAGWEDYAGVGKSEWLAAPKRVRQQSIRYPSGYIQDLDIDIFEYLKVIIMSHINKCNK